MSPAQARPAPLRLLRKEDLLDLWFSFPGLRLDTRFPSGRVLVRADPAVEGWIVVTFGPQHVAERAYYEYGRGLSSEGEPDVNEVRKPPPVPSRISGRSVLVFVVGEDDRIGYSEGGLLDAMRTLRLRVVDAARAPVPVPGQVGRLLAESIGAGLGENGFARAAATLRRVRALAELAARHDPSAVLAAVVGEDRATEPPVPAEPEADPAAAARPGPENPLSDLDGNPRTGIELPYRLLLSPPQTARWSHRGEIGRPGPEDRVELWHTRTEHETARAVWTRDPDFDPQAPPPDPRQYEFRMSLDTRDRHQIVQLTSNYDLTGGTPPAPVDVGHLMLSALGGWLDSTGRWPEPPEGLDVTEWRHRAAMGRDHYVRVMYAGRLCPFGHRAELVKVTERKFDPHRPGEAAYLYQRMFIVVRQPVVTYDQEVLGGGEPRDRLDLLFPFTSVRLLTLVTPDLAEPVDIGPAHSFFPVTDGEDPFRFKVGAVDREGRTVEFHTPLLFVGKTVHENPDHLSTVLTAYNAHDTGPTTGPPGPPGPPDQSVRKLTAELRGQSLAFAPADKPDDTKLDVAHLVWGAETTAELLGRDPDLYPRFVPRVRWGRAVIPQVSQLSSATDGAKDTAVAVRYPSPYAKHGFTDGNRGGLYVELVHTVVMNFHESSDSSGALVSPTFSVAGVSRLTGPVAAPLRDRAAGRALDAAATDAAADAFDWTMIAQGMFDPTAFFGQVFGDEAKLFGVIPLKDLLGAVGLDKLKAPNFFTETVNAVTGFLGDLRRIRDLVLDIERTFPEIAQYVIRVTEGAEIFARSVADYIVGQLKGLPDAPTIEDVENAFNAFSDPLTTLRGVLPAGVDTGVRTLLERIQQQVATWDDAVGGALALKKAIETAALGAKLPEVLNARMEWQPKLKNWPEPPKDPFFRLTGDETGHEGEGHLSLVVDRRGSLRPDVLQGADVTCTLQNFDLLLVPGVLQGLELHFERIRFTMRIGRKPDIEVKFGGVKFVNELSFVETLRRLIPLDGFSDPPAIDVTTQGITANYSMPLPSVAVGVFSLENISLSASLQVPFVGGDLEVGFAFCRREAPFRLTVSMLGGGGYFGIVLSPRGIAVLEAALEFGAAVSMNFGVASGSLSVMAGVYFRLEAAKDVKLVGYFRARGEVDVLGLVSASIELYLEIGYENGYAVGRATLTISIEIGFFEESVEISCEKRFAGSGASFALLGTAGDPPAISPPTFAELMSPYPDPVTGQRRDPVHAYCTAFAEVS